MYAILMLLTHTYYFILQNCEIYFLPDRKRSSQHSATRRCVPAERERVERVWLGRRAKLMWSWISARSRSVYSRLCIRYRYRKVFRVCPIAV